MEQLPQEERNALVLLLSKRVIGFLVHFVGFNHNEGKVKLSLLICLFCSVGKESLHGFKILIPLL